MRDIGTLANDILKEPLTKAIGAGVLSFAGMEYAFDLFSPQTTPLYLHGLMAFLSSYGVGRGVYNYFKSNELLKQYGLELKLDQKNKKRKEETQKASIEKTIQKPRAERNGLEKISDFFLERPKLSASIMAIGFTYTTLSLKASKFDADLLTYVSTLPKDATLRGTGALLSGYLLFNQGIKKGAYPMFHSSIGKMVRKQTSFYFEKIFKTKEKLLENRHKYLENNPSGLMIADFIDIASKQGKMDLALNLTKELYDSKNPFNKQFSFRSENISKTRTSLVYYDKLLKKDSSNIAAALSMSLLMLDFDKKEAARDIFLDSLEKYQEKNNVDNIGLARSQFFDAIGESEFANQEVIKILEDNSSALEQLGDYQTYRLKIKGKINTNFIFRKSPIKKPLEEQANYHTKRKQKFDLVNDDMRLGYINPPVVFPFKNFFLAKTVYVNGETFYENFKKTKNPDLMFLAGKLLAFSQASMDEKAISGDETLIEPLKKRIVGYDDFAGGLVDRIYQRMPLIQQVFQNSSLFVDEDFHPYNQMTIYSDLKQIDIEPRGYAPSSHAKAKFLFQTDMLDLNNGGLEFAKKNFLKPNYEVMRQFRDVPDIDQELFQIAASGIEKAFSYFLFAHDKPERQKNIPGFIERVMPCFDILKTYFSTSSHKEIGEQRDDFEILHKLTTSLYT